MRRIAIFDDIQKAREFSRILTSLQVENHLEDNAIWVVNENQIEQAKKLSQEFSRGQLDVSTILQDVVHRQPNQEKEERQKFPGFFWQIRKLKKHSFPSKEVVTKICILLSVFCFFISWVQKEKCKHFRPSSKCLVSPLEKILFYDSLTSWRETESNGSKKLSVSWIGLYSIALHWKDRNQLVYGALFTKIRSGEVWRLFTPIFLHIDILHIVFNMMWLWFLGKTLESRIGSLYYLLFIGVAALVTNSAQYLMTGPFFCGFSGVISSMVGFIWVKRNFWERPVDRNALMFLIIFILGMCFAQIMSFLFEIMHWRRLFLPVMNIANTAHVSGLLLGIILGKSKFISQ